MKRITGPEFVSAEKFVETKFESPLVQMFQALTKEALENYHLDKEYLKVIKDAAEIWDRNSILILSKVDENLVVKYEKLVDSKGNELDYKF